MFEDKCIFLTTTKSNSVKGLRDVITLSNCINKFSNTVINSLYDKLLTPQTESDIGCQS